MRQIDLEILKSQLVSKIETQIWRKIHLRFTDKQRDELMDQNLQSLSKLLIALKELHDGSPS